MSRFPNDPWGGFRQAGFPVPPGEGVPNLGPNTGPRIARFNPLRALAGPQNMTLAALVKRQQELADQGGGKMPLIQSWTQGASHMLDKFLSGYQQGTVNRQLSEGNALQAGVLSSADPTTGLVPADEIDRLTQFNPELAYKLLSDRREQMNKEQEMELARTKVSGETGAKITDIASAQGRFANDEYVQAMKNAGPMWESMQDAVTRDTPQADLNMVIAMAKLFDPTSVVRTEEGEMVRQTAGVPSQVVGWFKMLTGTPGARLDAPTRKGMMEEAYSRMKGYYTGYQNTKQFYSNYAINNGMQPTDIVQVLPEPMPWEAPEQPNPPPPPADPNTPPEQDVDPATLPSIPASDTAAHQALPRGAQYTVPGVVNPDGKPTIFVKQ